MSNPTVAVSPMHWANLKITEAVVGTYKCNGSSQRRR
jgi:hypothetical protein